MKYVFGTVAFLVVIIGIIVLLISWAPSGSDNVGKVAPAFDLLKTIDSDSQLVYTIDGGIVAEEEHRAVRFIISRNERKIQVLSGYSGTVIQEKSYPNTQVAFENFVKALNLNGFATKRDAKNTKDDEKGECSSGRRYVYEVKQGGQNKLRLWSSSCSDKSRTFGGKFGSVDVLFKDQFPDYATITKDVDL